MGWFTWHIVHTSQPSPNQFHHSLIYGFCGKLEGEEILRANYQVRMMVIRFSDTSLYGDIKITYGKQNCKIFQFSIIKKLLNILTQIDQKILFSLK
jgi:hypothetical protein